MPEHSQITALDHSGHDVCKMTKDSGDESLSTTKGENKKTKGNLGTQGAEQAGTEIYASRVNAASALFALMNASSDLTKLQSQFLAQEKESIAAQSNVTNTLADSKNGTIMKNARVSMGLAVGGAVASLGCMAMSAYKMNEASAYGKNAEGNMGKIGDSLKDNLFNEPKINQAGLSAGTADKALTTDQAKGLDHLTGDFSNSSGLGEELKARVEDKQYSSPNQGNTNYNRFKQKFGAGNEVGARNESDIKIKLKDSDRAGIAEGIENKPFMELFGGKDKLISERADLMHEKDTKGPLSNYKKEKLAALDYITNKGGTGTGSAPTFKEVSYKIKLGDKAHSEKYNRMVGKKLNKAANYDKQHAKFVDHKQALSMKSADLYGQGGQIIATSVNSLVQVYSAMTDAAKSQNQNAEQINRTTQQQNSEARNQAKQAFMSVVDSSKDVLRNS